VYTEAVRGAVLTLGFLVGIQAVGLAQSDTRPSFTDWLAGVRAEALARGVREDVLDEALGSITEPEATVIERDRSQAEVVLTLEKYLARQLRPAMIRTGRTMFERHRALLDDIGSRYGVPPQIIVAVWGLESNFGKFSGVRPTIAALATLAWDPRRPTLFRAELFDALDILNRGDIDVGHMKGSWAGAMGQTQFLPSSYLKWAEDFDGDGRRDIWSSPADVFASIANYLKAHGWTAGVRWGREVKVSREAARAIASDVARRTGSCQARRDMTVALPLARWQELGVRLANGGNLPKSDLTASIVSGTSRHFLVYANYDALLEYNCSHSYAVAVALLGDRVTVAAKRK
jgi:peptidoglycan lytic transglycosylase B